MSDRMNQQVPLSQRRGCNLSMELGNPLVFVKAPVENASPAIAHLFRRTLKTNVLGMKYDPYGGTKFAFQYRGHSWTILGWWNSDEKEIACEISEKLETRCIFVSEGMPDSSSYFLFDRGRCIEEYYWGVDYTEEVWGISPEQVAALVAQIEDKEFLCAPFYDPSEWDVFCIDGLNRYQFRSQIRTVTEAQVKNSTKFLDMLFRDQDAWLPDWEYLPWSADTVTAVSATAEDFVRVDAL